MRKHVLFIHGAGKGAYDEDRRLATSLQSALGAGYDVQCPRMPDEENAPFDAWKAEIETRLAVLDGEVLLVGHSVGASILLKWLSQSRSAYRIAGLFLIAAPYWGGDEGWHYAGYEQLELPQDVAVKLNGRWPIFFYHSRDDEIVPFGHLALYAATLPRATIRAFDGRGHQFKNDLTDVAEDIKETWRDAPA